MNLLALSSTPRDERLALVDHAYQPIVSTSTLKVHGFEALARLPGADNAKEVVDLLDDAFVSGDLRRAEGMLVCNAISKFSRFDGAKGSLLFCNVDTASMMEGNSSSTMSRRAFEKPACPRAICA